MVVTRLIDTTPDGGVGTACWVTADGRTVQVSATAPALPSPAWITAGVDIPDLLVGMAPDGAFCLVHPDGTTTPVTDREVARLLERPAGHLRFLMDTLNQEGPARGKDQH